MSRQSLLSSQLAPTTSSTSGPPQPATLVTTQTMAALMPRRNALRMPSVSVPTPRVFGLSMAEDRTARGFSRLAIRRPTGRAVAPAAGAPARWGRAPRDSRSLDLEVLLHQERPTDSSIDDLDASFVAVALDGAPLSAVGFSV